MCRHRGLRDRARRVTVNPVTGTPRPAKAATLPFSAYTGRVTWNGQRLRKARARAGITSQTEAAARIGVSVRAYAAWERDEAKPQAHWLPKLEEVLGDHAHTAPTERLDQDTIERALDQASFLDVLAALARKHARVAQTGGDVPDLPPGRFAWHTADAPSARQARETSGHTGQPDEAPGGRLL